MEKLRVLVLEDSTDQAELILEMLGEEAAGVVAQYLSDALRLVREQEFDVILADLGLPDSNGMGTAHALRHETKLTPIIVLTVLDDEAYAIESLQTDIQDYLVKDEISKRTLLRSIRYAIERKRESLERERIENALRMIQAQLQVITDTMPVGVAQCSRDLRYLWCSPEYARWLERSPEEVVGHAIAEVIGAGCRGQVLKNQLFSRRN